METELHTSLPGHQSPLNDFEEMRHWDEQMEIAQMIWNYRYVSEPVLSRKDWLDQQRKEARRLVDEMLDEYADTSTYSHEIWCIRDFAKDEGRELTLIEKMQIEYLNKLQRDYVPEDQGWNDFWVEPSDYR